MDAQRLGRDDWLGAGRRALLTGGPGAVRVERLAAELGVTKGSFYWHFTDRAALLEALLQEWEDERSIARRELPPLSGAAAVRELMAFLRPRVIASERGEVPSDAAVFAWASTDPDVARRVNAAEAERVALLQELVGEPELGEFVYLAYLGFVMRRRRVPAAAAFFPALARLTERAVASLREADDHGAEPARPEPAVGRPTAPTSRRPAAPGASRRRRSP
jgi:AcrR family transcriptional regulator